MDHASIMLIAVQGVTLLAVLGCLAWYVVSRDVGFLVSALVGGLGVLLSGFLCAWWPVLLGAAVVLTIIVVGLIGAHTGET